MSRQKSLFRTQRRLGLELQRLVNLSSAAMIEQTYRISNQGRDDIVHGASKL